MRIIAARISALPDVPEKSATVALSRIECEQIAASFNGGSSGGEWGVADGLDTSNHTSDEVRQWLTAIEMPGRVNAVWIDLWEGFRIDFTDFVQSYDDLWFPGSDDVIVISDDGSVALTLSHEEIFTAYRKRA